MLTLKLSDEVLATMGLTNEATPEQAETAIKDSFSKLKEANAMNELTMEVVDKLSKRVEAIETRKVELPGDWQESAMSNVREIASGVAKAVAAQEVSAAIAKAGSVSPPPAPQPDEKPAPTIREQFAAIKNPVERGRFWQAHSEELLKTICN